jgi:hypothetical protein
MDKHSPHEQSIVEKEQSAAGRMSRRRFLQAAGTAGVMGGTTLVPSLLLAQSSPLTPAALRSVVDAADLAITDAQLEILAPAMDWAMGELRKLRDVDVGLGGPAPVFLPAASAPRGGKRHE